MPDQRSDAPQGAAAPGIIELDFDFNVEDSGVSEVFFKESEELLSDLDEHILKLESSPHDELLTQSLFRKIHTLKGSAGAVPGGQLFSSLAHEFEALLEFLRRQKLPPNEKCFELFLHSSRLLKVLAENLRCHREIFPEELSEVIEMISRFGAFQYGNEPAVTNVEREPVIAQPGRDRNSEGIWMSKEQMSSLLQISSDFITLKNVLQFGGSNENLHRLSSLTSQLQSILDQAQKVKIQEGLSGIQPLARQAAQELRKEVDVICEGFDLEVDKLLAQDLSKVLTHMIRNSMDHGIETSEDRIAAGKSERGFLKISFREKASVLYCDITDDGRGLNPEKIRERALAKGLINGLQAQQLSEQQIFAFIFNPGFSTKERVTTLSGRGVGMDVVQNTVQKHHGTIEIESEHGKGCTFRLKIPLPKALLVERCLTAIWKDTVLAFPLIEVASIVSAQQLKITEVDGLRFCQYDGKTTPLMSFQEYCSKRISLSLKDIEALSVVFLKSESGCLGFLVDKVQNQTDLVIKPFSPIMSELPGFKGTSILADDVIAYVVDPSVIQSLLQKAAA